MIIFYEYHNNNINKNNKNSHTCDNKSLGKAIKNIKEFL